jgi:predicted RNase H-like nuclease (RuvC/YqgF family)
VVLQWLTRALFHRQRAFRERKERHIKELEIKIVKLEEESKSVGGENERLKKEIAQLNNKNSTLRATNDNDDLDHYVEYASWRSKQRRL